MSEFLTIYAKKNWNFLSSFQRGLSPLKLFCQIFPFFIYFHLYIYKIGIVNGKKTKIVW